MLVDLVLREAVLLVICIAFGLAILGCVRRADRPCHSGALVPAVGLAVGAGVLLSVNLFVPLRHAFLFVVLPVAALAVVLARRSRLRSPGLPELARLAFLLVFALGSGSYVLVERETFGPTAYGIFDGPGYITFVQGFEGATNDDPLLRSGDADWPQAAYDEQSWGAPWNLSQRYGWAYRWQHTASQTVPSVAAGLGGWAPWTMIGPMLAVAMACGALAVYALAGFLGAGGIGRTAAGVAYCGPLLFTVLADGSAGLVAGLAVVPAVLVFVIIAFERPLVRTALVAGALVGGLQAIYPEILPAVVGGLGLAAVATFAAPVILRHRGTTELKRVLRVLPVAVGAGLVIGLRSVPWTWEYIVGGTYSTFADRLVKYNMDLEYLPGWLFQTREFYSFAFLRPTGLIQGFIGIALPLALVGVSLVAFMLLPRARWLAGVVIAVLLQALWVSRSLDCSYCAQRSLLVLTPILPAVLVAGAAVLTERAGRRGRDALVALGSIALVAVVATTIETQQRVREGAVVPPAALSELDETMEAVDRPVLLEGYQSVPYESWLLQPTTYAAATQATTQRLSVVADYNEFGGFSYLGTRPVSHPSWTPDYGLVLTRFGDVAQPGRQVVRGSPPYVLMSRAFPFDVTVAGGVASDSVERDPAGAAWVQAPLVQAGLQVQPLEFRIAAAARSGPAFLRLQFKGPPGTAIEAEGRPSKARAAGGTVDVCARVEGGATRSVRFRVTPEPPPFGPPLRRYENTPQPAKTVQLLSMGASTRSCSTDA